jgi:hypothetical protein
MTVAVGVGALIALEASAAVASDRHQGRHWHQGRVQQVVHVSGDGAKVTFDDASVKAGSITFVVSTTAPATQSSNVTLFKPKQGKTLDDVLGALAEELDPAPLTAAKGTRDLVADATFHGLADVVGGTPMTVTERLDPGTYYAVDLGTPPAKGAKPATTRFDVSSDRHGVAQDSDVGSRARVAAVDPDRFSAPRVLPHRGTLTFVNRSDTIHFMDLTPVKDGTTDKDVSDAFAKPPTDPNAQPAFFKAGPSGGADVLSPGGHLQLSYDLPRGTYVLLCFVADDVTGMPHALMGMHKVVVLK